MSETLDLNDLLPGAGADADNVSDLLHFTYDGQDTTVELIPRGLGSEQKVVLQGINLTALGDDGAIIATLLSQTKFVPDA